MPFERLSVLLDFVAMQVLNPSREKNSSPGMDFVMTNKQKTLAKPSSEKNLVKNEEDEMNHLLEFVWHKI